MYLPKALVTSLALAAATAASAQPNADFSATPTAGCSPLIVEFTDLSTGGIISWFWDFGNSGTSDTSHPIASYVNPGSYDVTLIVFDGTSYDTIVKQAFVTVFENPTAVISATPLFGCEPLTVDFTDQSTPGSGTITSWLWDFGDGNTSNQQHPVHTYASGIYTVSLQVIDDNGCEDVAVAPSLIVVSPRPNAAFNAQPEYNCDSTAAIAFSNNSTGVGVLSYQWDFGDGNTSTLEEPVHVYNAYGSYTVQLIVTDASGCADTLVIPNYVNLAEHTTAMSVDKHEGCIYPNKTVFKFMDLSGPVLNYRLWDFGDGSQATQKNPSHVYDAPGTYIVTLITGGPGCRDTITDTIVVHDIHADYTADITFSCEPPLTVNFTDLSSNAVSWKWLFGDGDSSSLQNPTHTYTSEGTFQVTLIATNPIGCIDTIDALEIVIDNAQALFLRSRNGGCAPLTVDFTDISQSTDPITTWEWTFGDGNSSSQQNPSNTYTDTGVYTVSLIVTTATGCKDTAFAQVVVGLPPTADFTATPTVACASQLITFDINTDFGNQFDFDFGDGSNASNVGPGGITHLYRDTGWFTVRMTARHNGCPGDTTVKVNYIYINGPVSLIDTDTIDCATPFLVPFIDESIDPQRWKWLFGDGDSSSAQHPTHQYPGRGAYTVTLITYHDDNVCSDTISGTIVLTDPEPTFTMSDSISCPPLLGVVFDATGSLDSSSQYFWSFGNGNTWSNVDTADYNGLIHPPAQDYTQAGQHTVSLFITDQKGCVDTFSRTVTVLLHDTRIDVPTEVCINQAVQFNDSTKSDAPILSWVWNFGDGFTSTDQHPQHTYVAQGSYTVILQTADTSGCVGADTLVIEVNDPRALFTANKTFVCKGENISFNNTSAGDNLSYNWFFGDGDSSTLEEPTHSYDSVGTYSIMLIVTDDAGCADTQLRADYITVSAPIADFASSDTSAPCPPLLVTFNDLSTDAVMWQWDFGDGTGSSNQSPQHLYTSPGSYDVQLIVTNLAGCKDTLLRPNNIVIGGPDAMWHFDPDHGCPPLTVTFWVTDKVDVADIFWDFGDGFVETGDSVEHVYDGYGSFFPTLILNNGLPDSLECERAIQLPPVTIDTLGVNFSASVDRGCVAQVASFVDSTVGNLVSWDWDFGNGNTFNGQFPPDQLYDVAGSYQIKLVAASVDGCIDSLVKTIVIYDPPEVTAWGDTFICEGGNAELHATNMAHWSYNWQPAGTGQNADASVSPTTASTYFVIVTDTTGCKDTSNVVSVGVQNIPIISAAPDTAIILGDSVQIRLTSDQAVTGFVWSPDYNLSCADCPEPVAFPRETTTYTLTAMDTSGCFELTTTVTIEVIDDITIAVPDAFTPNGDGQNDVIYVRGWGIEELLIWRIYNRWGEVVYESNDINQGWDGTYRNTEQNSETYTWYARVRSYNGVEKEGQGSFHLVR